MAVPFKPSFWPTVAALGLVVTTLALGQWQLGRAHEKRALYAAAQAADRAEPVSIGGALVEPQAVAQRHVRLRGHFLPETTVYIDNRMLADRAGFYVITAFVPADGGAATSVNRGWWPRDPARRDHVDAPPPPAGDIEIEGKAAPQLASYWNLSGMGADKDKGIWLNFALDAFAQRTGLVLQPFVVQQTTDTHDELVRLWDEPGSGAAKHYGYAVQWFGLAGVALVMWARAGLRRGRAPAAGEGGPITDDTRVAAPMGRTEPSADSLAASSDAEPARPAAAAPSRHLPD
ncbi:SURF1 family protein [Derxia gummosa]|uniref:SURF1-like protein n=1 Tax=Derxia gummosa DSM 723 TaxID=1121388 RepID=A0A8B6X905_9BURK|nr:SURF1 family protein [Derxia gummosa]